MMKLLLACCVVATMVGLTQAASILWTGYADNNQWDTANNWYPAQIPGAGDDVTIHTGNVQATTFVSVNSLLMGDRLEGKANLTIFNGFNTFNGLTVYQNGNVFLTSGASALSGSANIAGALIFSSGTVSGTVTVTGTADLSGAAAKTVSGGALTLSGSSKLGGVISLVQGSTLTVSGTSVWNALSVMTDTNFTGSFTAAQGTVELASDVSIQANGAFGTLTIDSGVNLTLYTNVSFANTITIPTGSWVTTVGSAIVSTTLAGNGSFVSMGKSSTFGAQSFAGMIACGGVSCTFGGKTSSVGNLVLSAGNTNVEKTTTLTAGLLSIQSGILNIAGWVAATQLNFLGAGAVNGGGIKAKNFYSNTQQAFNLNGGVAVSTAANIEATTLSFGANGMFHLGAGSTSQVIGAFALSGPPNAAGFSNNGALFVKNTITSTNINLVGTGAWTVSGSNLVISGAELAAASVTLTKQSTVTGTNACVNIGAVNAGTVKAKIDSMSFQCTGSCANVVAPCSPMPANTFSFSG